MQPNDPYRLTHLWHALLGGLQAALGKPKVPPEMFSVARAFMRDNHVSVNSERSTKTLQAMHGLYCTRLHEALAKPNPPAAVIAEARKFLEWHGIKADLPAATAAQIAGKLADGNLPFTKPTKPH